MTLMKKYLDKSHTLYIDSRYTSSKLFQGLYKHSTNTCTIMKWNSPDYPKLQGILQLGKQSIPHTAHMMAIK